MRWTSSASRQASVPQQRQRRQARYRELSPTPTHPLRRRCFCSDHKPVLTTNTWPSRTRTRPSETRNITDVSQIWFFSFWSTDLLQIVSRSVVATILPIRLLDPQGQGRGVIQYYWTFFCKYWLYFILSKIEILSIKTTLPRIITNMMAPQTCSLIRRCAALSVSPQ